MIIKRTCYLKVTLKLFTFNYPYANFSEHNIQGTEVIFALLIQECS